MTGTFLPGVRLCGVFYRDAVRPLLQAHHPGLAHAAARIGPGSDVLGYDTARSTDHDWGPRLTLFLDPADHARHAAGIDAMLRQRLPKQVLGWPTHFTPPDARVRVMTTTDGPVAHRVDITTVEEWTRAQFGAAFTGTLLDWLGTPAQVFAETVGGAVYHDDHGTLTALRKTVAWYPTDVWRYVLAAQWTQLAQEEAFPGRAVEAGDVLGARVVAARLARQVMRLRLLQAQRWPPYSKWLGTAHAALPGPGIDLDGPVETLVGAVVGALEDTARRQNDLGLCAPVDATRRPYFDRPYEVIDAGRYAAALTAAISDPVIAALPPVGAVDQYTDSSDLLCDATLRRAVAAAVLDTAAAAVPGTG
ncbi:DUF4037 domain-containing protein [Dactylosporangium aurantiacum]|uniref:DUF4037 domain-containing protein n=1 Tax=Dactylosporangium aurantiacum TaxID=35754 RepID=A0A9Q9I755_9ACTN|nr:DUF4037 domain-containing protein [Dactylosporangium aurantiacum]MDG6109268.1 DUF4037 domain-containing protein [Dactylosporangium aurantiacum]UWZ50356.1 DUF4037 domain-containing protein [Dactylosporangium aurantiacum]